MGFGGFTINVRQTHMSFLPTQSLCCKVLVQITGFQHFWVVFFSHSLSPSDGSVGKWVTLPKTNVAQQKSKIGFHISAPMSKFMSGISAR